MRLAGFIGGLLLTLLAGCSGSAPPAPTAPYPAFTGSWGPHETYLFAAPGEIPLWADVYYPIPVAASNGLCIVTIHGGAWYSGDRTNVSGWEVYLRQAGYTIVSLDYRLTPLVSFVEQVDDCRTGLSWTRNYARTRGLDPERIGIMGVSAGAHLATLVANCPTQPWAPWTAESTLVRPSAVLGISGAYDFRGDFPADKPLVQYMLGTPERAEAASPLIWLDSSDPPHLLMHGDSEREPITPLDQAERMHQAALAAGVDSELAVIRQADHGLFVHRDFAETIPSPVEVGARMVAFFNEHLLD